MNRSPYSAYRGRKSALQRVLIAIVILLVIALVLATLALFVLPRYVVDTPNGPQLVLPLLGSGGSPSAAPPTVSPGEASPTASSTDSGIVVEPPSATPSPTPAPAADLSGFERRDIPLGLVLTQADALDAAGSNGALVDMTDADLSQVGSGLSRDLAAVPYAAAWLSPDWTGAGTDRRAFNDDLSQRCLDLAALGFDEIVFSAADLTKVEDSALSETYTLVQDALTKAGWQGRLGLELDQSYFSADSDTLIPCVASRFDRLYFRATLKTAHKTALTNGGFTANGYTLVTVVQNVANLNYAWAILP